METEGVLPCSKDPATGPYSEPVKSSLRPHTLHPLRSILILSSHLHLDLPSGLFPLGFPSKTLYAFLISPMRATCPTHLTVLGFITLIIFGEAYKLLNSSYSLLQPPIRSRYSPQHPQNVYTFRLLLLRGSVAPLIKSQILLTYRPRIT